MEKIIKALFESSFIFNGKSYVLTCSRDLADKTGLNIRTIKSNLTKIINENILRDTGLHLKCDIGPVYYHGSTWILYEFNLPQINLYNKYSIPYIQWEIEKQLNLKENQEETGD